MGWDDRRSALLDAYVKAVDAYRLTVAALMKTQQSDAAEFTRALKATEDAWKKAGEARRALQLSRSKKNP